MYVVIKIRKMFRRHKFKQKVIGPFATEEQAGQFIIGLKSWFINKHRLHSIKIVKPENVSCDDTGCQKK